MLAFCDEVCVVDGGSIDGTWEELEQLQKENDKLKIKQIKQNNITFIMYNNHI